MQGNWYRTLALATTSLFAAFFSVLEMPRLTSAQEPASYTFTEDHPPLFAEFRGQILSLPDTALSKVMGTTTWTSEDRPNKLDRNWLIKGNSFTLTRTRHWVITGNPEHFGVETVKTVTTVKGYSKTQATTFASCLEVSAGVSAFNWFKAGVKGALSITQANSETWQEARTDQTQKTYKAGSTVVTWTLLDTLYLVKQTSYSGQCCATTNGVTTSVLDIWVFPYEDATSDENATKELLTSQIIKRINPMGQLLGQ